MNKVTKSVVIMVFLLTSIVVLPNSSANGDTWSEYGFPYYYDLVYVEYTTPPFRQSFYRLCAIFANFVGRDAVDTWELARCPEERESEHIVVSAVRYFDISKEELVAINEEIRQFLIDTNAYPPSFSHDEIPPANLIFTFDNDLINYYFLVENTPFPREFRWVNVETGNHRPLFYAMPPPFADIVGRVEFLQWRRNRSEYERANEHIAVSFIRYFDVSREDFEAANEYMRFVWLNEGFGNEDSRIRAQEAGRMIIPPGLMNELYPVDLIFTFDNELINEYFRWENALISGFREYGGAYVHDIHNAAITISNSTTTATGTGNFTMSDVTWSANQTATVTLFANPGYTFSGLQNASVGTRNITINGNPATIILNTGGRLTISHSFDPPHIQTGRVRVDGQFVIINEYDQRPIIINDRMLVPLRAVMEELGFTALWAVFIQTATLSKPGHVVNVYIGVPSMHVNGRAVPLDVPAQLMNDRTMVPLRAIAEATGFRVEWDEENFIADIFTN